MAKNDDDIDLWHLAYKHRVRLAPLYLGATTGAAGVFATAALDTGQTAVALGAIAVAGAALIRTKIRDGLRRMYAYTVLGSSTSWAMITHEVMPTDWAAITWLAGTLVLGTPWWASRRKHTQVKLDEMVRDWPKLGKRIGIGESRLIDVVGTSNGYSGKITWLGGTYKVDIVRKMTDDLEGVLPQAKRGSVETELDGKSTNSIKFRVITRDPHEAAQPWPLPQNLRRGTDFIETGIRADGTVNSIQRFNKEKGARHVLIGGQTESGKSSLVNVLVANDVVSEDTWTVGFDFKRVELGPYRKVLGYMTHEVEKARKFVIACAAPGGAIDERTKIMEENNTRVWDPAWGPWIDLVIDEAKNLLGATDEKFLKLYTRLKTEGRAVGFGVVESTQYPTLEAVGSSQGRQQNRYGFCFRMMDQEGETYVIPGHRIYAERISEDRPGTCYKRDGSKVETSPERIFYINDSTRDALVYARAGLTAELDERTEAAITGLFPEFAERERYRRALDENGEEVLVPLHGGTGSGTGSGTDTGTEDEVDVDDRDEDETVSPLLAVLDDDGPDMNLADVIRAKRDSLSPEDRDREDREREAALTELDTADEPSEDEAILKLRKAMIKAKADGLPAQKLAEIAGRKRTWLYKQLNEWAAEDMVKRVKHGHWAWAGPTLTSVKGDSE